MTCIHVIFLFFFNDTATTEIYTLSLHDALPISGFHRFAATIGEPVRRLAARGGWRLTLPSSPPEAIPLLHRMLDRKSTRLNSSHANISFAVFCLKKKKRPISSSVCLVTASTSSVNHVGCKP